MQQQPTPSYKVLDNGQVLEVLRIGESTIETHHDMLYHVNLVASSGAVTASVEDWEGNLVDYEGDFTWSVNGVNQEATGAVLPITPGDEIIVMAWVDKSRAGELTIGGDA